MEPEEYRDRTTPQSESIEAVRYDPVAIGGWAPIDNVAALRGRLAMSALRSAHRGARSGPGRSHGPKGGALPRGERDVMRTPSTPPTG